MPNLHVHFTTSIARADANALAHALARHAVPDEGSFIRGPGGLFRVREVRRILALDAEFKEEEHPRDKDGAFKSCSGAKFFSGSQIDNTYADARDPRSRSTIVHMSPAEFLAMAEPGYDPDKAERVAGILKEKGTFNTLPHMLIDEHGKVIGHEGRHRMRALEERDIDKVPVELRSTMHRWGRNPELPTHLEAQGSKRRIPLPESQAFPRPAQDAWKEEQHPRGQPDNAGQFASQSGGKSAEEKDAPSPSEAPKGHLYKLMYRPPSFSTLPPGVKWEYVEAPKSDYDLHSRRPDLPVSKHQFGVIKTERPLTPEELRNFEIESAEPEEPAPSAPSVDLYERSRKLRVRLIAALKKEDKVLTQADWTAGNPPEFEVYERRPDGLTDWDKGKIDPETLSPALQQLLERYTAAEGKLFEEAGKPPKPPRPSAFQAAHEAVEKILHPADFYEKLKQRAAVEFEKDGITLSTWHNAFDVPDELELLKADGGEPIEPTALTPKQKRLWDAVAEANKAAAAAPAQLSNMQIKEAADIITTALGYDASRLTVSDEEKTFMVNGKQHITAGECYTDTGKIIIYAKHASPSWLPGLTAHETMHGKFQAVLDAYNAEKERMRKAALKSSDPDILKPDDSLREQYAADYPIYAALHPVMERYGGKDGGSFEELRKSDGVTAYSREYWAAWEKHDGTELRSAYHETLAEMARLDWMSAEGGPSMEAAPAWKRLYRTINKIYRDQHLRPPGEPAPDKFSTNLTTLREGMEDLGFTKFHRYENKLIIGYGPGGNDFAVTIDPDNNKWHGTWGPNYTKMGGTGVASLKEAFDKFKRGVDPDPVGDAEFREDMVKRDDGGKFATQAGGAHEKVAEKTPGAKPAPQADVPGSAFNSELREQMKRLQGSFAKFMVPSAKQTQLIAQKLAEHMGVATDKIKIDPGEPPKSRLGAGHQTQASSNSATGEITFWPITMSAAELPGIAAHEMMHQKWDKVLAAYTADNAAVKKLLAPHVNGSAYLKLKQDDGATPYSKIFWVQRAAGTGSLILAMHETLAEIARLDLEGQYATVKVRWRRFYEAVNKAHALLAKPNA